MKAQQIINPLIVSTVEITDRRRSSYLNSRAETIRVTMAYSDGIFMWEQHHINQPIEIPRQFRWLNDLIGPLHEDYWILHNISGPAFTDRFGKKKYALYGKKLSREEWFEQLSDEEKREVVWGLE